MSYFGNGCYVISTNYQNAHDITLGFQLRLLLFENNCALVKEILLQGFQKLNYVWKLCALNFQVVAVSWTCIRFFSFRYRFKALNEWSLIFVVFRSKWLWISDTKGLKNSNFSPKAPTTLKLEIWNSGYCWLRTCKISKIAVMDMKLWMEEDLDLHTNHLWSSFKFIHLKMQDLCKIFSSFSHNFISIIAITRVSSLKFWKL